jgi:hypothetical protein
MQRPLCLIVASVLTISIVISCSNSSKVNQSKKSDMENTSNRDAAGPPAIIYKTNGDYYDKVPVTLSADKTEVVSYPGVKDVFYKGGLAYPTRLNDGFLLDNRGIDPTSAFLNITYEAYSKLEKTPAKEELMNMIIDKDPFIEMYSCGNKYKFKDIVAELNESIDSKSFDKYSKLK